jgi:hypothetical protein
MVDVLMLAREHSAGEVELAVRSALTAGAHDGRAIAVLTSRAAPRKPATLDDLPSRLAGVGAPPPILAHYDQLLATGASL